MDRWTQAGVVVALTAGLGWFGCSTEDASDSEGQTQSDAAESPSLCGSCEHAAAGGGEFGNDTSDLGGSPAACAGEAVGRTMVSLEAARSMGFDPDARLDAAEMQIEASVRWNGFDDHNGADANTLATIEVRRTGMATLVDWGIEPGAPGVRCHDGDYIVPHVEVSVTTTDGNVSGTFESNLGPTDSGDAQPQRMAGGTMLQLVGDGSKLRGNLRFNLDPERDERLLANLRVLYDHPRVSPRAELVLTLNYDDGGGWTGVEGHTARPADDCQVLSIPQSEVTALGLAVDEVDSSDDCYLQGGDSGVTCCTLRDSEDPNDGPARDADEGDDGQAD